MLALLALHSCSFEQPAHDESSPAATLCAPAHSACIMQCNLLPLFWVQVNACGHICSYQGLLYLVDCQERHAVPQQGKCYASDNLLRRVQLLGARDRNKRRYQLSNLERSCSPDTLEEVSSVLSPQTDVLAQLLFQQSSCCSCNARSRPTLVYTLDAPRSTLRETARIWCLLSRSCCLFLQDQADKLLQGLWGPLQKAPLAVCTRCLSSPSLSFLAGGVLLHMANLGQWVGAHNDAAARKNDKGNLQCMQMCGDASQISLSNRRLCQ